MDPVIKGDSAARKNVPIVSGVLDYFPDALAAVARVSKVGNDKHNPGQPLHWQRGVSEDHADCVVRHLMDRGGIDQETGVRHSAEAAWRALALLQKELEDAGAATLSRGSWPTQPERDERLQQDNRPRAQKAVVPSREQAARDISQLNEEIDRRQRRGRELPEPATHTRGTDREGSR